jgi:hypothetical protein
VETAIDVRLRAYEVRDFDFTRRLYSSANRKLAGRFFSIGALSPSAVIEENGTIGRIAHVPLAIAAR